MHEFRNGDYILYYHDEGEVFPGRIIRKTGENTYEIEICLNKRKSEKNLVEVVEVFESRLERLEPNIN